MGQTPEWFSKAMGYGQSISGMNGAGVSPWVSEARGSTMYRSAGTALRGERFYVFLTFLCVLSIPIGGCEEQNKSVARDRPVIEFTSIAVAGAGDPDKLSAIRGRVSGARPGQQIVLYAKGETAWWVQPFANQPFTKIQPDSQWENSTHPGTQYAALLVGPEFHPPLTPEVLPTEGVFATAITHGGLPFWRKWWFPLLCVFGSVLAALGFYRLRLHQLTKTLNLRFEERLAERMRVAQELHDTLLQGMVSASMQLDVAVDRLPADSPVHPSLTHILQLMRQVIEEGRNTLKGLRSSGENSDDVKLAFLRIPQELGASNLNYRVIVGGSPMPLQAVIREEVYSIGREALVNAFRHSGASNIEVELEYTATRLRVVVRDNGCGINGEVIRLGRDGHWGLSGMRERAERIGAKFKVSSGPSAGTEVDLSVPAHVAFRFPPSDTRWGWLTKLKLRLIPESLPKGESGRLG
jgi:signal transduction histidine kinase